MRDSLNLEEIIFEEDGKTVKPHIHKIHHIYTYRQMTEDEKLADRKEKILTSLITGAIIAVSSFLVGGLGYAFAVYVGRQV